MCLAPRRLPSWPERLGGCPWQGPPLPAPPQGSEPGAALSSVLLGARQLGTAEALSSCPPRRAALGASGASSPPGCSRGHPSQEAHLGNGRQGRATGARGSGQRPMPGLPGRPPFGLPAAGEVPGGAELAAREPEPLRDRRPCVCLTKCPGGGEMPSFWARSPSQESTQEARGWEWG